jgi:hypothetical protein
LSSQLFSADVKQQPARGERKPEEIVDRSMNRLMV